MSLVTPDLGLLFWMVVIFGTVFFLLAKFGFPIITDSLDKRNAKISKSLKDADEIAVLMSDWKVEHARLMEEARREHSAILRSATETKSRIMEEARTKARLETEKMVADAKRQIAAEKESALRDVRKEIALLSVEVAEKILRSELSDESSQRSFIDSLVDEAHQMPLHS